MYILFKKIRRKAEFKYYSVTPLNKATRQNFLQM